jgi:hypothetical protein
LKKITPLLLALLITLSGCNPSGGEQSPPPAPTETASPAPAATPELTPSPTPEPTPRPTPDNLVKYDGPLHHVFYHFLIAFPKTAIETSYMGSLDTDCVTPGEFRRSLEQLYKNGFVLTDLNSYADFDENGKLIHKDIMVPEGKKPLVMSFDDINYYSKNHGKGIGDKLVLDENGKLAMLTVQEDGSELITYDNDVVPLLERFCEEYPDFAPFGVKGMLCLTGFDGVLGYRVQRDSPKRESEMAAAAPVIEELKRQGWYFASHSYAHMHAREVEPEQIIADAEKWEKEIAPVVGDTGIYVFPYGEYTQDHSDPKFQSLLGAGFKFLCGVGMPPHFKEYETYAFMDRQNIDGFSLRTHAKWLAPLMDNKVVYSEKERKGE